MSLTEFTIIKQLVANAGLQRQDVILGSGDDAALLAPPPGQWIVAATDTLVSGKHFFPDAAPGDIAYKALVVNLSDFAAMGAKPAWVLLALTLPQAAETWLTAFSQGLATALQRFGLQLVGGDTTEGPLTVTIQLLGWTSPLRVLCRSNAKPGDEIYVTGHLGDAGLALTLLQNQRLAIINTDHALDPQQTFKFHDPPIDLTPQQYHSLLQRLQRPEPRVTAGLALAGLANSAIDISDGLAADLNHLLEASQVGASIQLADLPLSPTLQQLPYEQAWRLALSAGDDYELCFTLAPQYRLQLQQVLATVDCPYTRIGHIDTEPGLRIYQQNGQLFLLEQYGFEHFSSTL